MFSLGIILVILGIASLILPIIGVPIDALEPYQPWGGIIVTAIGLITLIFARRRRGGGWRRGYGGPPGGPGPGPGAGPGGGWRGRWGGWRRRRG
jgi:hypothetical protein